MRAISCRDSSFTMLRAGLSLMLLLPSYSAVYAVSARAICHTEDNLASPGHKQMIDRIEYHPTFADESATCNDVPSSVARSWVVEAVINQETGEKSEGITLDEFFQSPYEQSMYAHADAQTSGTDVYIVGPPTDEMINIKLYIPQGDLRSELNTLFVDALPPGGNGVADAALDIFAGVTASVSVEFEPDQFEQRLDFDGSAILRHGGLMSIQGDFVRPAPDPDGSIFEVVGDNLNRTTVIVQDERPNDEEGGIEIGTVPVEIVNTVDPDVAYSPLILLDTEVRMRIGAGPFVDPLPARPQANDPPVWVLPPPAQDEKPTWPEGNLQGPRDRAEVKAAQGTLWIRAVLEDDRYCFFVPPFEDPDADEPTQDRDAIPTESCPDRPPRLIPGDANQDLQFNQVDIVQVMQAGKYLTGERATWGEGDWNFAPAPAGTPGNPPAGDRVFDQRDIIVALANGTFAAAVSPGGGPGDEQTSIVYDATTGELAVNAPASTELTSINIDSATSIFTGAPATNLGGSFDNDADDNIFKATFGSSFGSLSFGNVAQPGLSEEFLLSDLTVIGSLAGGGDLGDVDLIYVPEPASVVQLMLGYLGLGVAIRLRRRMMTAVVISNTRKV